MEILSFVFSDFFKSCGFFTAGMIQDVCISFWKGKGKSSLDLLLLECCCAIEKPGITPKNQELLPALRVRQKMFLAGSLSFGRIFDC